MVPVQADACLETLRLMLKFIQLAQTHEIDSLNSPDDSLLNTNIINHLDKY